MTSAPAGVLRRVVRRIRERDPEFDALRRAVRAAVVVPAAAAVSFAIGGSSQTPLYTIFGSFALMVLADFPGNPQNRAVAYAGLGLNGAVLITLGTLVSPHAWLSVALMFVLGVVVTFSGVLSETIAAGQRPTLLTFVLPACTPPGPIGDRLLGWGVALAVCVPASLFLLPPRHHGELRRHAANAVSALADRLEGKAVRSEVVDAMLALRENYLGADFRPVGLTAGSRALVRVVEDLEWLADRVSDEAGPALRDMQEPGVRVLRCSAAVLRHTRVADRETDRANLEAALIHLRSVARGRYRSDVESILAARDDATAVALGRQLLNRRTIAATIGATGRVIAAAAAADARPVWARALGRRLPPTTATDRLIPETAAVTSTTTGFLSGRSVAVRNALRTGLGLALAVAVTHVFPVEHGFWVVLGALSVLRSSALTTGTKMLRAVLGTGIGFVLGAVLISAVGVDPAVLWILMPIVVFGSAFVPEIASFTAGQAAFTMMVLIFFNLIVPTGWSVGLIRVEDVVVGALVGAMVSVLLWPRGATASATAAVESARGVFAQYLERSGAKDHPRRVRGGGRQTRHSEPRRARGVSGGRRRGAAISLRKRRDDRLPRSDRARLQPGDPGARGGGPDHGHPHSAAAGRIPAGSRGGGAARRCDPGSAGGRGEYDAIVDTGQRRVRGGAARGVARGGRGTTHSKRRNTGGVRRAAAGDRSGRDRRTGAGLPAPGGLGTSPPVAVDVIERCAASTHSAGWCRTFPR